MTGLDSDVRFAWRSLNRSPGFAAFAIGLMALGIGGTTLIFSAADALLLRRLPVAHPEELARIVEEMPNRPLAGEFPYLFFEEWRKRTASFRDAFAQSDVDATLSDGEGARPVHAQIVTGNYFSSLGVSAEMGRVLLAGDEWASAGEMPVVLSYRFWSGEFQGRSVLGRVLHLDEHPFVIVGILPEGFNGISVETGPDVWLPFIAGKFLTPEGRVAGDPRRCCMWEIAGRLRAGVGLGQAQSETQASFRAAAETVWFQRNPVTEEDRRWVRNLPIRVDRIARGVSRLRGQFSAGLWLLLGAVFLLLLLACANVAGLLLARATVRERETAIRLATGASRARLVRQWLVESSLVAFAGGVCAFLLAWAAMPLLVRSLPPIRSLMTTELPLALEIRPDLRLFGFAFLVSALTAVLAGLTPAWHASRTDLITPLKGTSPDPRRLGMRSALVAFQVAISTAVLAGAVLLTATLRHLESLAPGFDEDHVVTFTVNPALLKYTAEQAKALSDRLAAEARRLPGVRGASVAIRGVMRGAGLKMTIGPAGSRLSWTDQLNASLNAVSPEYFDTMGMRLVAGRDFGAADSVQRKPRPVMVNQALARRLFPGRDPVGQMLGGGIDKVLKPESEIIGVVTDAKYRSLREPVPMTVYECLCVFDRMDDWFFQLQVRTYAEPATVIRSVEAVLRGIDPRLPVEEVRTLREETERSLWQERLLSRVTSAFALLAALLAGTGLYGMLAYTVAQRRRDIGIRMALGASTRDILRAVSLHALGSVAAGLAGGIALSLAASHWIGGLLYGISPASPLALGIAASVMLAAAIAAATAPAARAARVDPAATLRQV